MSYLRNFFIGIDQLGNTLAGGDPDNTISSRIGYNVHHSKGLISPRFWIEMEKLVDFTFWPIDGEGHCHQAFHSDAGESFDKANEWALVILDIITGVSCLILIIIFYTLYFCGLVNPKKINRTERLSKRLSMASSKIHGINHDIDEGKSQLSIDLLHQEFNELYHEVSELKSKIG